MATYVFASTFQSRIFWIEEPNTPHNFGKLASQMCRLRALLPLPTTKEFILLFDYNASIDCWCLTTKGAEGGGSCCCGPAVEEEGEPETEEGAGPVGNGMEE